jgi:undecaprenyl diphosphate synthase
MAAGRDATAGLHVAIIMDGNGRWAAARGLPRSAGHQRGAAVVRTIGEAAPGLGIGTLTLYAFSADNWRRPRAEVLGLMRTFDEYLCEAADECPARGVRLSLVGRRDRLPPSLRRRVEAIEGATLECSALHLRLAIDYSAREAIWLAAGRLAVSGPLTRQALAAAIGSGRGEPADAADVDLLIRTGGERRLSDFLLWESAYAELWFTDIAWPDFTATHLAEAVADFSRRDRRFGGLGAAAGASGRATG